ncbi:uncharacterized protein LOC133179871 [Saccostrea echinata]|uniref:uncharacterized protein LOC133179871 n=1 Tax=Saccostrea echinata TaxID=191078 RepID=UPI002A82111F|nr:uncharacterized protein LOC133179871 [Saccostrea echinata]
MDPEEKATHAFLGNFLNTGVNLLHFSFLDADALLVLNSKGFTYKEISKLFQKFKNKDISVNATGKRLKRLGVPSRRNTSSVPHNVTKQVIENLLPDLPETVGYRSLTSILRRKVYAVQRDVVMKLLRKLDPEGTKIRRRR